MLKVKTPEEFVDEINLIIREEDCSVMEAIIDYAERYDVEFDKLKPFIERSFKGALRSEAERKNLLKKENVQLPI